MFDIGFWELVVVVTVALLVFGPERLPELARDAGKWVGKISRYLNQTRREIETELRWSEKKHFGQQLSELDDLMRNAPDQDPDHRSKQISPAAKAPSGHTRHE